MTTTNNAPKWIAYYRVSTKRQSLGLDAQRERVLTAAREHGATVIAEVEEKESGRECQRPGLNRAMALARKYNATLVVAKADRLSRDLAYATIVVHKSGINVLALNLPPEASTDYLLFGVYFGLAAQECKLISDRTKAALAALKAKGVKLGRPDAEKYITRDMVNKATAARVRNAQENPNNVASVNEIRRYLNDKSNKRTLQAIADHLTENGFYTSRGVFHTTKSVDLLCKRYNLNRKTL